MSTPIVIDASAGVELVARTERGNRLRELIPADAVPWVPDGLFDVEVGSVLRRWDLNAVLDAAQMEAALLRLRSWPVRRASVRALHDTAWLLRHNMSYGDAVYVALAQRLAGAMLTDDHKLANAPTLTVPVLTLPDA
ncbi:MAG: type II toxin-antitoxin system VapC family toxin [Acidimicrobiales bacterium]